MANIYIYIYIKDRTGYVDWEGKWVDGSYREQMVPINGQQDVWAQRRAGRWRGGEDVEILFQLFLYFWLSYSP